MNKIKYYQSIKYNNSERGITLLEILIVLAIIALLAAVVGPRMVSYLARAKSSTAALQLDGLKTGAELFYIDLGRYPTETEGLARGSSVIPREGMKANFVSCAPLLTIS